MFHQFDLRYLIERLLFAGFQDTLTQNFNHAVQLLVR